MRKAVLRRCAGGVSCWVHTSRRKMWLHS